MGIVGSERVFKILDTNDKIDDNGKVEVLDVKGDILFENVWFAYKEKQWVLTVL